MATTKVSALAEKGTLGGSEEILINDGGTSKKATITAVRTGATDATKLPLAGGTMTGNIVMSGSETVDGVDISARDSVLTSTTTTANAALPKAGGEMTGNITMAGSQTVDGRDLSADGTKLDGIEASADVTDATNVTAAGALMDSEVTNLSQVKAFDSSDYATAAQGTTADAALPKTGGAMTGAITTNSTFDGVDVGARDAVLTSTTTTANAALPKAGGTMTGAVMTSTDTDTSNAGSVTLNFSTNQNFVLTLTDNVTLANPTTETVGQSGFITFIQDGTGSRTVSLGTDYETAGGAGLTLTSTASATDIVPYVVVASGRILLGTPQLAFA